MYWEILTTRANRPEFGYDSRFEAPGSIPQHPYEMSANMHDGPWEMHAP